MNYGHQSKKRFAFKKKNDTLSLTQGTQGCVKTQCPVD